MSSKSVTALIATSLVALTIAGCGSSSSGNGTKSPGSSPAVKVSGKKGGLISIIVGTQASPYWRVEGQVAKTEAIKLGYKANVAFSNSDLNTESTLVDTAIANKSVALILDPTNATGSVGNVRKAKAAGIPVFLINAEIDTPGIAKAQLISNNAQGAAIGATQFVKDVGQKGNYVELFGLPTDNNATIRSNGYKTVISQYPGLKKVAMQTANWDRTQGHDKMQSMLQAHPNIIGLISGNDEMALGAIAALKEAGKLAQVKVGAFDGSPDAVTAVKNGQLLYTVLQPMTTFTKKALEEADTFIRTGKTGSPVEKQSFNCMLITKANAGKMTAPFTYTP